MSRKDTARAAGAVAPGTVGNITAAVAAVILPLVAGLSLETRKEGVRRAPFVFEGWEPPKETADVDRIPCVIVRPRSGEDSQPGGDEKSTAVVEIEVWTYSDTDDGWRDVALIIDAIRFELGLHPWLAGTQYEQTGPLAWEIPRDQQRPEWFGVITTTWTIPRPVRAPDTEAA